MRCLLIDNYDSFTWNLAHYVAEVFGEMPTVVYNDQYSWDDLLDKFSFDCIIVSPGPGSVTNEKDFHVSRQALMQDERPVLGVCLGFQGLAHVYGGTVMRADIPFHGRASDIHHTGDTLFAGLPSPFSAVRYHSLMVSPMLPTALVATAQTESGILMGIRHKTLPKWGVQFHPESILTEYGHRMIRNYRDQANSFVGKSRIQVPVQLADRGTSENKQIDAAPKRKLKLLAKEVDGKVNAEDAFMDLYAWQDNVFWLDSAMVKEDLSRFSFMGQGADGKIRSYRVHEDADCFSAGEQLLCELEADLDNTLVEGGDELPFAFRGGWVGYMSYEMKALFGAVNGENKQGQVPDAIWIYADRFLAFDHVQQKTWAIAIAAEDQAADAEEWLNATSAYLRSLPVAPLPEASTKTKNLQVTLDKGYEDYLSSIDACQQAILDGDSYEVCLTNQFRFEAELDPVALYRVLRKKNAAPFCAFIKSGSSYVLSTSPERFLEVNDAGKIQAKPIKGTCPRSVDAREDKLCAYRLRKSEKDLAENLMIVDLMRNDLSRVSEVGSVLVDKLMEIETYATVHHMVSTVEAKLDNEKSLMDLVRATFPGGSISGAPKIRTMQIIDSLEDSARGVYCGSIGYLGFNRVADLNIAIRTLTYDGRQVRFGAGGAITYLSNSDHEFKEIMVKANAVLGPIWAYLSGSSEAFEYKLSERRLDIYPLKNKKKCTVF